VSFAAAGSCSRASWSRGSSEILAGQADDCQDWKELFAFQEFCTHRFGPLSEGAFDGFNLQCPWHNSCFDVRTGKVTNGPAKVDLKTFKMETRDGKIGVLIAENHDQKT
jgi:nitrite reductase/ring-hydroxylating ferredoxin subunit